MIECRLEGVGVGCIWEVFVKILELVKVVSVWQGNLSVVSCGDIFSSQRIARITNEELLFQLYYVADFKDADIN